MAAAPKLRVLCLHGASQDAEIFSQRLRPLQKKCAAHAHFVFADAPHHLPTAAGQMVAMRVWWQTDADAVPYCGWPASLEALRAFWRRHGPFDGALGFSQGGAVACLMAGLAHATPGEFPGLRFVVVAGSPAPDLTYFPDVDLRGPLPCPSLHFVGRADAAVPPAESAALAETWFARAQVHRHEQGHVFPTRGPDVAAVQAFLADQQRRPPTAGPGAAATGAQSGAAPAVAAAPAPGPSEDPADAAVARLPRAAAAYAGALEEQEMELQALQAIFTDDELTVVHDRPPFQFTAKVRLEDEGLRPAFLPVVRFWLPPEYPDGAAPIIKVEGMGSIAEMCAQLGGHLVAFAEENKGMTMVFQVMDEASQWLTEHLRRGAKAHPAPPAPDRTAPPDAGEAPPQGPRWWTADEDDTAEAAAKAALIAEATAEALAAEVAQGRAVPPEVRGSAGAWGYTIGLVGKPSAGKSTFFNAAIDPAAEDEAARVAAHPFTTIDPNTGRCLVGVPCPCAALGLRAACASPYGHTATGERLAPVTLKDVAGLVPGAWQGRGRGNRFLDDLCDADVLVHVVDASGATNREGVADGAGGDPLDDVRWVRQELHCWIFGNLRAKWDAVRRRPEKLLDMFTGYHAREGLIAAALRRAGVEPRALGGLPDWGASQVHRIVAHFLRLRFPILLLLNKADAPTAPAHIARLRAALGEEPIAAASAKLETALCRWRRAGDIVYPVGGAPVAAEGAAAAVRERLRAMQSECLEALGGTGVLPALSAALALRPPVAAFPVMALETCEALVTPAHVSGVMKGSWGAVDGAVLWHCVLLRPGATVEDFYAAMKRPPFKLCEGDYVRAECRTRDGAHALLKKTEVITEANCVIKLFTNRKVAWQKAH